MSATPHLLHYIHPWESHGKALLTDSQTLPATSEPGPPGSHRQPLGTGVTSPTREPALLLFQQNGVGVGSWMSIQKAQVECCFCHLLTVAPWTHDST